MSRYPVYLWHPHTGELSVFDDLNPLPPGRPALLTSYPSGDQVRVSLTIRFSPMDPVMRPSNYKTLFRRSGYWNLSRRQIEKAARSRGISFSPSDSSNDIMVAVEDSLTQGAAIPGT